ncbi:MAG: alpha/beta fold hydrolase [Anaerolineales bacterium]|nr:alpha/beta fold hydrolase [Anaerolineales bacterium]
MYLAPARAIRRDTGIAVSVAPSKPICTRWEKGQGCVAQWGVEALGIGTGLGIGVVLAMVLAGCRPVAPDGAATSSTPVLASATKTPMVTERPCDLYLPPGEVEGETIQCGYVTVPWDRTGASDANAQLAFVILKAAGANPQPDAILHVAGGPGAGSTLRDAEVEFSKRYASLRQEHDIILYDQRGMGHSIPYFACAYPDESTLVPLAAELENRLGRSATDAELETAACAQGWADQGFPVQNINTQTSAADLVDLMAALDYPAYNLYGVSYGTRLLMALMHFVPDEPRVRSIVLDSPYPLPEDKVNDLAGTVEREYPALMGHLFAACGKDEVCAAVYPELRERFDALVSALAAAPIPLADGSDFTDEEFTRR